MKFKLKYPGWGEYTKLTTISCRAFYYMATSKHIRYEIRVQSLLHYLNLRNAVTLTLRISFMWLWNKLPQTWCLGRKKIKFSPSSGGWNPNHCHWSETKMTSRPYHEKELPASSGFWWLPAFFLAHSCTMLIFKVDSSNLLLHLHITFSSVCVKAPCDCICGKLDCIQDTVIIQNNFKSS